MKQNIFKKLTIYWCISLLIFILSNCSETSVKPEDDITVTISPQGGEYVFGDGIKLRVPEGAVTEDTDITLKRIENSQLTPIFTKRGVPIENLLACIEGKPDGMVFNYPVKLILNVDLDPGEIPIVHEVDLNRGSYTTMETETICDPDQDTLVISLTHFSSFFAEILRELEQLFGGCGEAPCRCERIEVIQGDKDFICDNGDCQITETKLTVIYLDCPGLPAEESIFREVGDGCIPSLSVFAAKSIVSTGGATSIIAEVNLGCEPFEGQRVDFSIAGLGSLNQSFSNTNADGKAYSGFLAGDEKGTAMVTATSMVSYYTYTLFASAGNQQETVNGPLIVMDLNESVQIEIKEPDQIWSGTLTYDVITSSLPILEHAKYSASFTFFASPANEFEERLITGMVDANQDVSLAIGDACWEFRDLHAPNSVALFMDGVVLNDTSNLFISLTKFDESPFYNYTSCLLCVFEGPPLCSDGTGGMVSGLLIGNGPLDPVIIPLRDGTYSSSYSYDLIIGNITNSYSIVLKREQ